MGESPLSKDKISAAIQNAPTVGDVLKKLASKVARGVKLPETFSVKSDFSACFRFDIITPQSDTL